MKNLFEKDEKGKCDIKWLLSVGFTIGESQIIAEAIKAGSDGLEKVINYIIQSRKWSLARVRLTIKLKNKFEEDGSLREKKKEKKQKKELENYVDLSHLSGNEVADGVKNTIINDYLNPLKSVLDLSEKKGITKVVNPEEVKSNIDLLNKILDEFP